MKSIIVGNSHAAALKQAWTELEPRSSGISVDFFVAPNFIYDKLDLKDGHVFGLSDQSAVPPKHRDMLVNLNGRETVDIADFDAVILVGREFGLYDTLQLLDRTDVDSVRTVGRKMRISEPAFQAFLEVTLRRKMQEFAWNASSGTAIFHVPRPRQAEGLVRQGQKFTSLQQNPDGIAPAIDRLSDVLRHFIQDQGAVLVPPPDVALGPTGLTLDRFSQHSLKIIDEQPHDEDDFSHMNADYGRLQWEVILPVIAENANR